MEKRIKVKDLKSFRIAALKVKAPRSEEEKYFKQLLEWLKQKNVKPGKKLAIFYERIPEIDPNSVITYEVCFEIEEKVKTENGIQIKEVPRQRVATIIHYGSREKLLSTYETLLEWMKSEDYIVKGPLREIYVVSSSLEEENGLQAYAIEIQLPIGEESFIQRLYTIIGNWSFASFFVVSQWTLLFLGLLSSFSFPIIVPGSRTNGELKVVTLSHFWVLFFSITSCFLFFKHRHRGIAGKSIFVASLAAALFSVVHFISRFVDNLLLLMWVTEIAAWVFYLLVFATSVYSLLVVFIGYISRKVIMA